ncbi:MAG: NUDIX domain-containing protein [Verrucomicrobiaceae bacterium]|nr:MAG: NUDIX domain-containing protein [Verrucomicrobiaceae bacterium]
MRQATKPDKVYPMPLVRVDLVVLSVMEQRLQVLLGHREEDPYKGRWGLPGGVLRIDLDESLEAAAQRVALERLNLNLLNVHQVAAVGGVDRDARAPWAMSIVYRSLVQPDMQLTAGKRIHALAWRPVDELSLRSPLAFDHAALVLHAVSSIRREIAEMRFPAGWVSEPFTYGELQKASEAVLGYALDKVTFRRRMDAAGIALPLKGKMRAGSAHRPAQLYSFKRETPAA